MCVLEMEKFSEDPLIFQYAIISTFITSLNRMILWLLSENTVDLARSNLQPLYCGWIIYIIYLMKPLNSNDLKRI